MLRKPKILYFDIETSPLKAYLWQLGKQVVRHNQLDKDYSKYGIICITYCWNDGKLAKAIDWGYEEQDTAKVVSEFDKIIEQADIIIGKNNKRFDDKMINACRMFAGLPGYPQWTKYTDDLEKHMRKHFRLPSYSLDYISDQLGLGGKMRMEFQDWIDIVEKTANGEKALKKMVKYGKKDVEDTRAIWNYLDQHFETKINIAKYNDIERGCKHCGSTNLRNAKYIYFQTTANKRVEYRCKDCGRYAGSSIVSIITNKEGVIR